MALTTRPASLTIAIALLLTLTGCEQKSQSQTTAPPNTQKGDWYAGDLHVHTAVSADARDEATKVLDLAFGELGLDYVFLSNHMRDNSQDHQDNNVGKQLYHQALLTYEMPELAYLQANMYPDKSLNTTFEWDMPGHEHYNIAILGDTEQAEKVFDAIKLFEYQFSYKNTVDQFDPSDVAKWNQQGIKRYNGSTHTDRAGKHSDAIKALKWLQDNHKNNSYGMLNHPRRYVKSYTIQEIRDLNNAAPDVFFLLEGMVGGQFNKERGSYEITKGETYSAGTLGGVDPMVGKLGGWWDSLLGEGRKIWNIANSDHHFKIRNTYTSSYYPGEYAKNYTFAKSKTTMDLYRGLKAGQSFGVYGDLIDALEFTLKSNGKTTVMGGELNVKAGDQVTVTVRYKSPDFNNREVNAGDEMFGIGLNPGVHHIDLIAGQVTGLIQPTDPNYGNTTNPTTKVIKSFTEEDWQLDSEGYYAMTYQFTAQANEYYRLRGTNLDYNVEGATVNGEPQITQAVIKKDNESNQDYFNRLTDRFYDDLWFYSNPIFLTTRKS
ncbi:hypothetical protein J4N45_25820 [Vibrio sp. SCSIO 43140]|uniref:hypothetical protein n=1 Tax=Vibrio sp. SCSIO 43140 TaxID=2819100 RepID=UPI0020752C07|nr:hypothetical protein [Vibrio sp. SCSIO 43140]USD62777.1 hypothetical protein J4N45_25820 [Vibrio sp. SCSIO 43140]